MSEIYGKGLEPKSRHVLTWYDGTHPTEYEWTGKGWSTPGTGFNTRPSAMLTLGWRYHGAAKAKPMTTPLGKKPASTGPVSHDVSRSVRSLAIVDVLASQQSDELRYICQESAIGSLPTQRTWASRLIEPRHPQIAAHLCRAGLLTRNRMSERDNNRRWRWFWAYRPTAEGLAVLAKVEAGRNRATGSGSRERGAKHSPNL